MSYLNVFEEYVDEKLWNYLRVKFPKYSDSEFKVMLEELLKYLHIASVLKSPLLVTVELDDIWHAMIMETRAYIDLCEKLPSRKYIHHSSNDYDPEGKRTKNNNKEEEIKKEILFYANYVAEFGGFSSDTVVYWPRVSMLMMAVNIKDLNDLNAYLKKISMRGE